MNQKRKTDDPEKALVKGFLAMCFELFLQEQNRAFTLQQVCAAMVKHDQVDLSVKFRGLSEALKDVLAPKSITPTPITQINAVHGLVLFSTDTLRTKGNSATHIPNWIFDPEKVFYPSTYFGYSEILQDFGAICYRVTCIQHGIDPELEDAKQYVPNFILNDKGLFNELARKVAKDSIELSDLISISNFSFKCASHLREYLLSANANIDLAYEHEGSLF